MHKFYINLTPELNHKHYNFLIYLLFINYKPLFLSNKCSVLCIFGICLYKSGLTNAPKRAHFYCQYCYKLQLNIDGKHIYGH